MENVLNFHADSDDYYQEWAGDIDGNVYFINALPHVLDEMNSYGLHYAINFGGILNDINWRIQKPYELLDHIESKFLAESL